MRLLFIENDTGVRRWFAAQAEQLGVEVLFVDDDALVVETSDRLGADAVVIDVASCVHREGFDCHQLWRRLDDHQVPLLVYSSSRHLGALAECLGRHCSGALPSPLTLDAAVRRAKTVRAIPATRAARPAARRRYGGSPRRDRAPAW